MTSRAGRFALPIQPGQCVVDKDACEFVLHDRFVLFSASVKATGFFTGCTCFFEMSVDDEKIIGNVPMRQINLTVGLQ